MVYSFSVTNQQVHDKGDVFGFKVVDIHFISVNVASELA